MESANSSCHVGEAEENTQEVRDSHRDEIDGNGPKSLIMEIYPWIGQFKKMCRNSLSQRSMTCLKNLMKFYLRNARPSVNECHTKPLRAEKLRDSISETLLFFLYYYRDVGEVKDRDYYLIVMSDLMAMFIDMELKASKKGKEHCSKISARLFSRLSIYLENSTEHLLDTLLKVHFMTYNYQEILDPVIAKIFKTVDEHPSSSIMYVRYFLAYRLWKKLNKDVAVRNQINVIAVTSLGTAPTDFPPSIVEKVLPQVPKTQKLLTKTLLLQKFEVEKSCEEFLNFCNKERGIKSGNVEDVLCLNSMIVSTPEDNNDCRELITNKSNNLSNVINVTNQVNSSIAVASKKETSLGNSVEKSIGKSLSSLTTSSLRRSKKSNDIVFIDLTSDSITEKVIRSKKTRRKLTWLEKAKKIISLKTTMKKNSTSEDKTQPEDSVDLGSLRISDSKSTSPKIKAVVEKANEETSKNVRVEKETSSTEDSSLVISSENNRETLCTLTNSLVNKSPRNVEWSELETRKNEKNRVEVVEDAMKKREIQVAPSTVEIPSSQVETSTLLFDGRGSDQYSRDVKVDDTRELQLGNDTNEIETSTTIHVTGEDLKDKTLVGQDSSIESPVKPEHVTIPTSEIINDSGVSSEMEVEVAEYASEISVTSNEPSEPKKLRESEFQENIDGLSLLASVSQRISHLKTRTSSPVETIKVKNYASMANLKIDHEADSSSDPAPFCGENNGGINRLMAIYPEDEMDKVAYQVEITSTDETDIYPSCDQVNDVFSSSNETRCSQMTAESTSLVEKDDTNVILNGETVVLFQKSPNSNLYIINKAVENRDHVNDESIGNLHREMAEHVGDPATFPYEIYDSMYRSQNATYEISQYSRELLSQEARRGKLTKTEPSVDSVKACDSHEPLKPGKKNSLDVMDDKARIKRKLTNSGLSRRRRIKQEYNGCGNNISMKTPFGLQDCPSEHPDSGHPIHIPVAHANPISSMYTKYPTSTELYLSCHKNCNSLTCGLPVNPTAALHPGQNASGNSRCSCLNCAYGIVTHCSECILPNGEPRGPQIENSYYVSLHSGKNSKTKDRPSKDRDLAKIYDDQLVCKFEQKILDSKTINDVKYEPKENYRAEFDNKLPLKKRFKAIMAYVDDVPIKCEKVQSYPSTPMLSIAALETPQENETKNSLDLSSKLGMDEVRISHQSREMIRRDYQKDGIMTPPTTPVSLHNGCQVNSAKRKRVSSQNRSEKDEESIEDRISKTIEEVIGFKRGGGIKTKDTESLIPTKNSTRKTRSSKRNVPKVNYIYTDGDSDWNPSGNVAGNALNKRKRKKTSR